MVHKLKLLFEKYRQFILYCIVGAANTLITIGLSYLCNKVLGWESASYAWVTPIIAYGAGIINGFFWSTRAVFKTKGTIANLTKFIIVNVLMIGLNQVLVAWLFHGQLGIDAFVSQVLATPFTFVGNFTLNKLWTFSSKGKG